MLCFVCYVLLRCGVCFSVLSFMLFVITCGLCVMFCVLRVISCVVCCTLCAVLFVGCRLRRVACAVCCVFFCYVNFCMLCAEYIIYDL